MYFSVGVFLHPLWVWLFVQELEEFRQLPSLRDACSLPVALQSAHGAVVDDPGVGRRGGPVAAAGPAPAAAGVIQLHVARAAVHHVDEHVELLIRFSCPFHRRI